MRAKSTAPKAGHPVTMPSAGTLLHPDGTVTTVGPGDLVLPAPGRYVHTGPKGKVSTLTVEPDPKAPKGSRANPADEGGDSDA